jgi:hypothetical protein
MEKMKELYEKVSQDSALRNRFEEIMKNSADAGPEKTGEELSAFAKGAGYEVSIEEIREFFQSLTVQKEATFRYGTGCCSGGKNEPAPPNSVDKTFTECALVSVKDKLIHKAAKYLSDIAIFREKTELTCVVYESYQFYFTREEVNSMEKMKELYEKVANDTALQGKLQRS